MVQTAFTLILATVATLVAASPVTLDKRCGTTILPSTQIQLKQSAPNTPFPNTAKTDKSISISQGPNGSNKVNELIAFTGAVGAFGCSLGITFPAGAVITQSGGPPTLNVHTVPTPLPANPTFNNIHPATLFGTVTVLAGQSTVINSRTCPTAAEGGLGFVFGYADWQTQQSSVGWTEYVNAANGAGLTGVFLKFNC
ncbi:hypothetical protein VE01_05464 [Pseudogymnoascus verrucosus]|uniref:Ubiquitin 3 binding protein But2 C-terminal domain-containing protein n=1 Tax=Pseudogymnoascus verrucosus TaxID=342668 RepID=A0A1B8GM58_9PEZI|nr:uncharacterized protein VE01_05464 [Pseudogymnoascus verrucosus]OBT96920.1 hypothetical protein VE01_05464 [Pseudogymnoascus verrucosus]